jgi:CBS domain-containing protein
MESVMRGSFSLGRWLGVDVRLHISLPVLLVGSLLYGVLATGNPVRGIGLCLAIVLALVVREMARILAAAYAGLRVRALFILPIGGIMALAPQPHGEVAETQLVSLAAPIANFVAGLLLLGFAYAVDPHAQMLVQPWISAAYILRSMMWMQFILGALNLVPSAAMPTRQTLRGVGAGTLASGAASSLVYALALGMMVLGFMLPNLWVIGLACVAMLLAQLQSPAAATAPQSEEMRVRDVMLTDMTLLSTSDTLEGALRNTVHSVQEIFPVVRGNRLVGAVARQALVDSLQASGDGYLQGSMARNLQIVAPEEPLVTALRRAAGLGASEFLPVVEDERVLGILSPQSLARAVQQVKLAEARTARQQDS